MATEQQVVSWLKNHERIVLVFMVLLVTGFLANKYIDSSAEKAKIEAATATQIATEARQAAADAKSNADRSAANSAVVQAQYQQMVDTLSRQNAALSSAITNRDSILGTKTAEVIQPKTPTAVVADLNEAYKGAVPSTVTADGQVSFDPTVVQRFTVTKIERDTFQSDLADETKVAANVQTELDKSNDLAGSLHSQIVALGSQTTALGLEITTQKNQCTADIKEVKDTARAKEVKAFKWGFGLGFVAGLFTGHAVL